MAPSPLSPSPRSDGTGRTMDITERLLSDAGIGPGMRVLDIGCGRGDVSVMLARRVGAGGRVVGLDRDAGAIASARERLAGSEMEWVRFLACDLDDAPLEAGSFDAVVGRRVLMYLQDPAATLRRLARLLRPGGRVVLQEHDATMLPGRLSPFPEHERLLTLMWRTVEREGADIHIGFRLPSILSAAGLELEHIHAEAIVTVAGLEPDAGTHDLAAIVRAMLPRMRQQGLTEASELDLDALPARLAAELSAAGTLYVGDMAFCAWARVPSAPG